MHFSLILHLPTKNAMQFLKTVALPLLLGTWLVACQAKHEANQSSSATDKQNTSEVELDAAASPEPLQEEAEAAPAERAKTDDVPKRQFVRTADVKCRVQDVVKTTERVEAIAAQQGGFTTHSGLDREILSTETVAISADSSLETTRYSISSMLILRVPNTQLDTTLRAIAALAEVVEHRAVDADDVALQLLATQQTTRRNTAHDRRLQRAIDQRGSHGPNRLGETTTAEESRLGTQQAADEALLERLSLTDQVRYSTVTVNLYERPAFSRVVLPNPTDVRAYEPAFFAKAADALATGGAVLEGFILLLLQGWGLFVFALAGYVGYRYIRHRLRLG
jgi:uncharacterized protein YqiB (DUF1249 family)